MDWKRMGAAIGMAIMVGGLICLAACSNPPPTAPIVIGDDNIVCNDTSTTTTTNPTVPAASAEDADADDCVVDSDGNIDCGPFPDVDDDAAQPFAGEDDAEPLPDDDGPNDPYDQ